MGLFDKLNLDESRLDQAPVADKRGRVAWVYRFKDENGNDGIIGPIACDDHVTRGPQNRCKGCQAIVRDVLAHLKARGLG